METLHSEAPHKNNAFGSICPQFQHHLHSSSNSLVIPKMAGNFNYLSPALQDELRRTAKALVAPGKGIFALDVNADAMENKFKDINVKNTAENRKQYREILFTTESLSDYIAGTILVHETVYNTTEDGTPFPELLRAQGIIPGVKVDRDLVPLYGSAEEEYTTQGLDDLAVRCAEYRKAGIRFVKLRCALRISANTPSALALDENAKVLARYASISQSEGLVPVVEPDVMLDGDHDILRCQKVTEKVLAATYKALSDYNVYLEGTILKTNMVTPGFKGPSASNEEVARATIEAFTRTVPVAIAGVGFLSGGMSDTEATERLNAINQLEGYTKPWRLSFSYGRALENSVVRVWAGKKENIPAAQEQLRKRCRAVSLASLGKYVSEENATEEKSNFIEKHRY